MDMDEILSNLVYISTFREGDKIDVDNYTTQVNTNVLRVVYNAVYRYAHGASRHKTFEFIKSTLDSAITMLRTYGFSRDNRSSELSISLFIKNLQNARKGIENQKKTYEIEGDTKLAADYETLIQTRYGEIENIQKQLTSKN